MLFQHLLNKKKVKPLTKTKPKTKTQAEVTTLKPNKQEIEEILDRYSKLIQDKDSMQKMHKNSITQMLDVLDEKAIGEKFQSYYDPDYGIDIQKIKKRYVLRNHAGDVLLSTERRKDVEEFLLNIRI